MSRAVLLVSNTDGSLRGRRSLCSVPSSVCLGTGSYGELHKASSRDGTHCGMMKVALHQPVSLCDQSDFVEEAISLSRLQHPCLTPVLSCGVNPLNVVWKAFPGCSAMDYVDRFFLLRYACFHP
jgi:hypothetical protein